MSVQSVSGETGSKRRNPPLPGSPAIRPRDVPRACIGAWYVGARSYSTPMASSSSLRTRLRNASAKRMTTSASSASFRRIGPSSLNAVAEFLMLNSVMDAD